MEVRREKRGNMFDPDGSFRVPEKEEPLCYNKDLLRVAGESWSSLVHEDHDVNLDRLLKQARSAGWLSCRADPREENPDSMR